MLRSLWRVMKSREFGAAGMRVTACTPCFWSEAWAATPTRRLATVHSAFLESGVVYSYDVRSKTLLLVSQDGWPDDMARLMFEVAAEEP